MYKTCQLFLVLLHRTILLAVTLVAGTLIYAEIEHISYENSGYFCWTVVTTIGYGFSTPHQDWGKIFTIIYGLIGIPVTMFCLVSYGSILNHLLKKIIAAFEVGLCSRRQVSYMHFKMFIALVFLGIGEMFLGGYAMYQMNDWTYLDSVYTWFVSMSTIGFGDFIPSFPPGKHLGNAIVSGVIHLFCMVTLASIIEAMQGMITSINNNSRGFFSIIFCCYKNEEKEWYEIQKNSNSSFGLNYVKD